MLYGHMFLRGYAAQLENFGREFSRLLHRGSKSLVQLETQINDASSLATAAAVVQDTIRLLMRNLSPCLHLPLKYVPQEGLIGRPAVIVRRSVLVVVRHFHM